MAAFVMQSLGCEVAALNTVQYSMPILFWALEMWLQEHLLLHHHLKIRQQIVLITAQVIT